MQISAVIPIRFADCCNNDGTPIYSLGGKPLWQITIEAAVKSRALSEVIVAFDDPRFEPHLSVWPDKIVPLNRPRRLSDPNASLYDVLRFVATETTKFPIVPDYLMLLEISHPMRPENIIDQIIDVVRNRPVDSSITCRRVHYNYWQDHGQGRYTRINRGDDSVAGIYQEMIGIGSVFSRVCLLSDDVFGASVDIIPLDDLWAAIDVRDSNSLWLAERYLTG